MRGDDSDGKRIKRKFLQATPAIKNLRDAVQNAIVQTERGRVVTPEGQSYLDNKAAEIAKDIPELSKY